MSVSINGYENYTTGMNDNNDAYLVYSIVPNDD